MEAHFFREAKAKNRWIMRMLAYLFLSVFLLLPDSLQVGRDDDEEEDLPWPPPPHASSGSLFVGLCWSGQEFCVEQLVPIVTGLLIVAFDALYKVGPAARPPPLRLLLTLLLLVLPAGFDCVCLSVGPSGCSWRTLPSRARCCSSCCWCTPSCSPSRPGSGSAPGESSSH